MSANSHEPQAPIELNVQPRPHVAADDLGFSLPPPAVLTPTRAIAFGLVGLVAIGAAFAAGYLPKRSAHVTLEATAHTAESAAPRVEVVTPHAGAVNRALVLPGSIHPLEETVIYSRANGFLRRWLVDIGDHVTEGQLLADIETPELDQELLQARAQLAQAEAGVLQADANRQFADTDLARYTSLAPAGVASQSDVDRRRAAASVGGANVNLARATVGAQRANIERLLQLKSFAHVVAPFAGMVTSRMVDRGALVTAGNATPLFHIEATDPVRVFVQVPQDVAPNLHAGIAAQVTLREYPGRTFEGTVSRTSGSLDPATRTMNTEVRVPNPNGILIAGMYAEVALALPLPHRVFELPAMALLNDAHGLRLATVGDDNRIHLVTVVVERDTGPTIQISTGLTGTERVVRIANVSLTEGLHVDIAH